MIARNQVVMCTLSMGYHLTPSFKHRHEHEAGVHFYPCVGCPSCPVE